MTVSRVRSLYAAVAAAFLMLAHSASAQTTTQPPAQAPAQAPAPAPAKPPAVPLTAGWQDGFVVQSTTGDFSLQIGALVQADGRFDLGDDSQAVVDTFAIRRLRPYLRGRIVNRFEFYINPDFAGSTVVLQDAYIDTRFSTAFRLRVGKAKAPFGLERLQSAANIAFFERGLPTALVPNRDLGVQVLGSVKGGLISYWGAVLNGVPDGGSGDLDNNDGKDLVGRIQLVPFSSGSATHPLKKLTVAFAGSTGKETGVAQLPTIRTSSLLQPFLTYVGSTADGTRTRYSPQATYFYKRFGALGELVHTEVPIRKGNVRETIAHEAWQVAGSFFLTGENATDGLVRPKANFDFGNGHLGAFQVAARYHTLHADQEAITLGLAVAGSSREADAWTLGLNWFWNPYIKHVFNFERTVFDGDANGPRKAENAFVFRTQLNF